MRIFRLLLKVNGCCLLLFLSLPSYCQENTSKESNFTKLVWSDEFDYNGLPDSSKWNYEVGLLRDHERQFYTYKRIDNINVQNGVLVIRAKKEKFNNENFSKYKSTTYPKEYLNYQADSLPAWVKNRFDSIVDYTSGSLVTLGKASWTCGKIAIKAKLPFGNGVWPVIWMLGVNKQAIQWPYCGEIDIMEHVGKWPKIIQANVHYADLESKQRFSSPKRVQLDDLSENYHVYSIIWSVAEIRFFIDDKLYHTFSFDQIPKNVENPFKKPFYLLINLALGGNFGGPIDDSNLPQELKVDYVRVYQ